MLKDQGKSNEKAKEAGANLTEFWTSTDPKVQALRRDVVRLHDECKYGDAFVIGAQVGKGRVLAVMTTAGKEWNNWGGGSSATPLYPGFIWEMQNFLSGQGGEANLTVGSPVEITVDADQVRAQHKQPGNKQLKMSRFLMKPEGDNKPAKAVPAGEVIEQPTSTAERRSFPFPKTLEPGLYLSELRFEDDAATKPPVAVFSHVFNVDTPAEGPLQRVSSEDLDRDLIHQLPGQVELEVPGLVGTDLAARRSDLSESPWFFLLLLGILVAEQALAVHLSFHLKGAQDEALKQITRPTMTAA
jgi:hypothetical protein